MNHLTRFLHHLKMVSPTHNGHLAQCPGHDDSHPSLRITVDTDGHIVLRCQSAQCSVTRILQAMDLTPGDLCPDPDDTLIMPDDQCLDTGAVNPGATDGSTLPDLDLRSAIYDTYLGNLDLSEHHRGDLRRRGLSDSDIDDRGYRSLNTDTSRDAVAATRLEHGDTALLATPGFVRSGIDDIRIAGPSQGLIIPSRDLQGRIQALKVRNDANDDEAAKYVYISAGAGRSCGAPTHVPLLIQQPLRELRVTEGELKADVATVLGSTPTIGIAGVSNWRPAIAVLQSMAVQRVHLAFDADCQTKPHVARQLSSFYAALTYAGFAVNVEKWNPSDGNGIDDLLAANKQPELLTGPDAIAYLNQICGEEETLELPASHPSPAADDSLGHPRNCQQESGVSVLPFPIEVFPAELQTFATKVAATVGCPVDLVAGPMLAVAATAIGASRSLEVKAGWQESPSLYLAIVAPPGSGKSPAESLVTAPVHRLQYKYKVRLKLERESHAVAIPTSATDGSATASRQVRPAPDSQATQPPISIPGIGGEIDSRRQTNEVQTMPVSQIPASDARNTPSHTTDPPTQTARPLPMRRVIVGDTTTEALANLLQANPRGILIQRDEISSWIKGMNQYKGGKGTDRQFYLSCWSGQTAIIDRKSQDEPVMISRPFVCVSGGIQPDMLSEFMDEKWRSDGFVDRIIFSYPAPARPSRWTDQGVDRDVKMPWENVLDHLFRLEMDYRDDEDVHEPRVLTFAPEAIRRWRAWYNSHIAESHSDDLPGGLLGPWTKLISYCLRFALVMQLLESASRGSDTSYVSADALEKAIKLIEYFKSHARKVYASLCRNGEDRRTDKIVSWIARHNGECTARDLQSNNVAAIKKASEANAVIKDLVDRRLGTLEPRTSSNGRTTIYFVLSRRNAE